MDTEHASPQFKVGDRVRITNTEHVYGGRGGVVIAAYTYGEFRVHVEIDGGYPSQEWFNPDELAHTSRTATNEPRPPLGVDCWRLLFRAHRNGWEMLTQHRPDELGPERCRWWHNANTGQVFAFTTVESR